MKMLQKRGLFLGFALLAVLGLLAASCGGDDGFEGVTLKFGKAPHGEDEIALFEEWLAPFEEETGINVEHTVVPWGEVESAYTASFAGNDPYDVTYQVSTHLTLFGERGAFVDVLH